MHQKITPLHLRWPNICLVATGGMIGTALRGAIGLLVAPVGGIPINTITINIVGAFALAFLLEKLKLRKASGLSARNLEIRLFAGTGLLGGFTTYSALTTDTVQLIEKSVLVAAGYALITLFLGAVATIVGITMAQKTSSGGNR